MRLGNYPVSLSPAVRLPQPTMAWDYHYRTYRHCYEFNNEFRGILEKAGLVYSALSPDGKLVEICELASHP